MAAMLIGLEPGDEVILPSFTFVSTANAFVRLGAKPVFVDIREDTLTIDERLIEPAITSRTRAIFPIHYSGVACEMDAIMDIASRHSLRVVEDAAQGVNAFYKKKALGSLGHLGTYSFHSTKNLACGEGGALCCNDQTLIRRAEILREKGTNRLQFVRGEVDKYTWVDVGSSYLPNELSCAYLLAQLEAMDEIRERRKANFSFYYEGLSPLRDAGLLRLPQIPEDRDSHYGSFHIVLNSGEERDALMGFLKKNGVAATFHFIPLHTSPVGIKYRSRKGDLPITESICSRILRLPCFVELTEMQQTRIIKLIASYLISRSTARRGDAISHQPVTNHGISSN